MAYIHFTDEQKRKAAQVNLADLLQKQGEQLKRSGSEWRWKKHSSLTINGNRWYWHKYQRGGSAIEFFMEFYHMNFPEAVTHLLDGQGELEPMMDECQIEKRNKVFILPERNDTVHRVYVYLMRERCLDSDVVTHFMDAGKIYEDKIHHNAVFVGYDVEGAAKSAHKRSTNPIISYKETVKGSDNKFNFMHTGSSDQLFVFEAPIDMLSFITLYPNDWEENSYLSLYGVAEHALLQTLKDHRNLKKIILCLDHDSAGIESSYRLKRILQSNGYNKNDIKNLLPSHKDWNEDIKAHAGRFALPALEHPKMQELKNICNSLGEFESKIHLCVKDIECTFEQVVQSYSKETKNFVDQEKVMEQIQLLKLQVFQMIKSELDTKGIKKDAETLAKLLCTLYDPSLDKGSLYHKLDDFRLTLKEAVQISAEQEEAPKPIVKTLYKLIVHSIELELHLNCELEQEPLKLQMN